MNGRSLSISNHPDIDKSMPVFILGGHRCGTTLLRYLVDSHENIACPPESKFLCALKEFLDYPQVLRALSDMGQSRPEILRKLRSLSDAVFADYVAGKRKRRWVDKTPNYAAILPFIEELYDANALYIVIVRHPLDCVGSLNSYFRATRYHEDQEIAAMAVNYGMGKYAGAYYWTHVYQRIRVFATSIPKRVLYVQYENLVKAPNSEMGKIFTFLGEDSPEDISRDAFMRKHDLGYGDKNIRYSHGVSQTSVGKWKRWPSEEVDALWEIVCDQARYYGYTKP